LHNLGPYQAISPSRKRNTGNRQGDTGHRRNLP
jgi:hypothetical protein